MQREHIKEKMSRLYKVLYIWVIPILFFLSLIYITLYNSFSFSFIDPFFVEIGLFCSLSGLITLQGVSRHWFASIEAKEDSSSSGDDLPFSEENKYYTLALITILIIGFVLRLWNAVALDPAGDEFRHLIAAKHYLVEGFFEAPDFFAPWAVIILSKIAFTRKGFMTTP